MSILLISNFGIRNNSKFFGKDEVIFIKIIKDEPFPIIFINITSSYHIVTIDPALKIRKISIAFASV